MGFLWDLRRNGGVSMLKKLQGDNTSYFNFILEFHDLSVKKKKVSCRFRVKGVLKHSNKHPKLALLKLEVP